MKKTRVEDNIYDQLAFIVALWLVFQLYLVLSLSLSVSGYWSLKNVQLKSKIAVRRSDNLKLECDYDLENALLYSIKWYFEDNEFYRFVPKESPPTRVFLVPGISVDVSKCFL